MEEKKFKAFDKVIVRERDIFPKWTCDFYSHYNNDIKQHVTHTMTELQDNDILPYEGNEHLVGTTDEPEEEVKLEKGEFLMVGDELDSFINFGTVVQCPSIGEKHFCDTVGRQWNYAIRFKDFDTSNMEETKKHILCVKNGKVVRYKN